jgi:hypothetical protein
MDELTAATAAARSPVSTSGRGELPLKNRNRVALTLVPVAPRLPGPGAVTVTIDDTSVGLVVGAINSGRL